MYTLRLQSKSNGWLFRRVGIFHQMKTKEIKGTLIHSTRRVWRKSDEKNHYLVHRDELQFWFLVLCLGSNIGLCWAFYAFTAGNDASGGDVSSYSSSLEVILHLILLENAIYSCSLLAIHPHLEHESKWNKRMEWWPWITEG